MLAVLWAPAARPAEGEAPLIRAIRFEGNHHLTGGDLRSRMRLHQKSWWKPFAHPRYPGPDFLASDLHAVIERYQEAGFPMVRIEDAEVRFDKGEDEVTVLIRVDEGPRVRLGNWRLRGLDLPWAGGVRRKVSLARGEPLSWPRLEKERDKVENLCTDKGHALARADLEVRYRADSADVFIDVDVGPLVQVDSIRVEGLKRAKESMVRRELTLKEGDDLRGKELLVSQQRLLGTGVFQRARLTPQLPDSAVPRANLLVNVEERKPQWLGAGAGYSSSDQVRFLTEWGVRNLTGMGRRLTFSGNLYYSLAPDFRGGGFRFREGHAQLDYQEPWILGTPLTGILSPYLDWDQEEEFATRTAAYSVTLRRDFGISTRVSVGIQNKRVETTQKGVVPRYTTRFLSLDGVEDKRDNIFDPASGRYRQATAEFAGGILGGTNQFVRLTGSWQAYSSPQPGWVVAARIKLGQIFPVGRGPVETFPADTLRLSRVPWEERFRVGGGNTIRGYAEGMVGRRDAAGRAIGGLLLFLGNVEVRFPLLWVVQGALFLDSGNTWADPSEFKPRRFTDGFRGRTFNPHNVAFGMGAGVRFKTPVGPFRFDYGFKVGSGRSPDTPDNGQGRLHVALGQAF